MFPAYIHMLGFLAGTICMLGHSLVFRLFLNGGGGVLGFNCLRIH